MREMGSGGGWIEEEGRRREGESNWEEVKERKKGSWVKKKERKEEGN